MKKIFGFVIFGIVIFLVLLKTISILGIYKFFYGVKDENETELSLLAINDLTKAITANPCNQFDYSEYGEFTCLKFNNCNLKAMKLQELKDFRNGLQAAVGKCMDLARQLNPIQTTLDEKTAGWKTYVDLYYFFKYPSDWTLKEPDVFGSGFESDFEYNKNFALRFFQQNNHNPNTRKPYTFDEFIGDKLKYTLIDDVIIDKRPAKHLYLRGGALSEEEIIVFLPNQKAVLSFYYQPGFYNRDTTTLNQILKTFKFNDESNEVVGIRLGKCCSCPATVPSSIIGQNGWISYEEYSDPQGPYTNFTPRGCVNTVCKPCSPVPLRGVSQIYIDAGWYWGTVDKKFEGTPDDWVFTDDGKNSCWHKPEVNCY